MSRRLVITRVDLFDRHPFVCAICEDHRIVEAQGIPEDAPVQILNNIYVARVSQVVKNIGAAFVEIEKGKKCFLPLSDVEDAVFVKQISQKQVLSQGDELLVQVVREAVKTKDPQVSTNLSLPGSYSVVTSGRHKLGVSNKLDAAARSRLKEAVNGVYDNNLGLIIRTNAAQIPKELLVDEVTRLQQQMRELLQYAPYRSLYSVLYAAEPEYVRILQNQPLEGAGAIEQVITDDADVYAGLVRFADTHALPGLKEKLCFYEDPQLELQKLYALQVQLERALQKNVWLKSGANLVIEPTEALTVIDVNSAKHVGKKQPQQQHLQVNLEAAHEIARQIRLRNLSGIIIIDFIDLDDEEDRQLLLKEMRKLVRTDSVKTEVIDLTKLGLMELTRQKVRKPLREQFFTVNGHAQG